MYMGLTWPLSCQAVFTGLHSFWSSNLSSASHSVLSIWHPSGSHSPSSLGLCKNLVNVASLENLLTLIFSHAFLGLRDILSEMSLALLFIKAESTKVSINKIIQ